MLAGLLWMTDPAAAQPRPDSEACLGQCGASMSRRADNPQSVQSCLIRCQALEGRLPTPPVVQAPAAPLPPPAPVAPAAPPLPPGTLPPPSGPGRATPPVGAPGVPSGPQPGAAAPAAPDPAPQRPPAPPPPVPGPRAEAAPPPEAPAAAPGPAAAAGGFAGTGAIYVAVPPSPRYGMVLGQDDRMQAHRRAENACKGPEGVPCRLAMEFRERCGAVAQGVISRGMVMTDDPTTYQVLLATPGSGPNRLEAEHDALGDCRQRHRGATCRIVASDCAG